MKVLYIAPFYKFFIKDFIENISRLEEVSVAEVMVFHNLLYEMHFLRPIIKKFKCVHIYTKDGIAEFQRKPDNVNLHVLSYFNIFPNSWQIDTKIFKTLDRYIKKKRIEFDLVHAHFTWPYGYIGIRLGKEYETPVVVTVHENRDWFLSLYNSRNEKIVECWRSADALIRVNKIDVPLLRQFNDKVFYVPNGFDPHRITIVDKKEARRRLSLCENCKIIFSLGALIERKGFHYLIEAMVEVLRVRKDVMCYIGGDGPMRDRLQKMIKEYDLEKFIKLLGYIPEEDLPYWINAADVFVLPSLSEGNPTVMFEALGVGIPFVGTVVGGIPEIISSEEYGLLVEPANVTDLSKKILLALEKDWNRDNIRIYGQQFLWSNIARNVMKIYLELLKK